MKNYTSIASAFFETVANIPNKEAYRYKNNNSEKETITYIDLYSKVNAIAKAFKLKGCSKKNVAIFSENRIEWFICDMALLSIGAIDIPRGNDSTSDELTYIIEHSESNVVLVENEYVYKKIEKLYSKLELIIFLDSSTHNPDKNIYSFDKFLEFGNEALNGDTNFAIDEAKQVNLNDVATIIYTSGTTGKPKGVVLTHDNILHQVKVLPPIIGLKQGEKLLTVLPIWHIYERMISYVTCITGCFTAITNKRDLKNDFFEEKPGIFISVPAIWINIYNGVLKNIEKKGGFSAIFAKNLIKSSMRYIRNIRYKNKLVYLVGDETLESKSKDYICFPFDSIMHKLAKKIVYKKIIELTGGRMRLTISGGGALPMHIEDFLEAVGINLIVGWGITETSPVLTLRDINKNYRGTCGSAIDEVEVEIRDKDGNICDDGIMGVCFVKGPNIFKEYYKDKELTDSVKVNGFFNTGDLGTKTKQGEIVLTGRAKETIVLLTGENVEPQPIENKLVESKYIHQVMLIGQDKPSVGAIIIINEENILEYLTHHKIKFNKEDLTNCNEVNKLIKNELSRLINNHTGFRSYECISKVILSNDEFTIDNGLLTQSLKMKRFEITEKFKEEIELLYQNKF